MPHHLGVPSGASKMIFWAYGTFGANHAPILHRHWHYLQTDRNEIPHDPHHLGVPLGASKTIFKPMVRSAQTVHLSCVYISTISKRTESSFRFSLVTKQYHRVCPKQFLSLWYVWCKPCSYPNGPKQDSTWPMSPRSSIGCVQNDFRAYGMFSANHTPILRQD